MSEKQGYDPSLENMAKKAGEAGEAALNKGKEAFNPAGPVVRNPLEQVEIAKSSEKKEQPSPAVPGNDSRSGPANQQSDSTHAGTRTSEKTGQTEQSNKQLDLTKLQEQDQKQLEEIRAKLSKYQSFKPETTGGSAICP